MELLRKLNRAILLLVFTWPMGLSLGLLLYILIFFGKIKIINRKRFPRWQRKIIVVSNHPSLLEPVLLPPLFFWQYLLNPFRYAPWSTPDRKNFYDKWYWWGARSRMIPIDRKSKGEEARSLYRIKEVLDGKGIVIIFPEGGRTNKGQDFLYSKKGNRIRELKKGIGWLVVRTGALVLPVWVEGTDTLLPNHPTKLFSTFNLRGRATIKIGVPLDFGRVTKRFGSAERVTKQIAQSLLGLSDEEE